MLCKTTSDIFPFAVGAEDVDAANEARRAMTVNCILKEWFVGLAAKGMTGKKVEVWKYWSKAQGCETKDWNPEDRSPLYHRRTLSGAERWVLVLLCAYGNQKVITK